MKKKKAMIALALFLVIVSLSACGWSSNKKPCEKGPGYWATDDGSMWFYTEGNNGNYWKANGRIVIGGNITDICIKWDTHCDIIVCDAEGNELFSGNTMMRQADLEDGVCKMEINEWKAEELFAEKKLTFIWQGENRPS